MVMNTSHHLFVYGTLKQGHGNHPLLESHDATFIGNAKTVSEFVLTERFPTVWRPPSDLPGFASFKGHILGELYTIDTEGLLHVDRLEGHPRFYCRTSISVDYGTPGKPRIAEAGIYLIQRQPSLNELQRPDDKGTLEWGRSREKEARRFQADTGARFKRKTTQTGD